ncbi:MAG: hypothetical protein R3C97_15635 [Geminicoccaceae bacterium]
MFDRKSGRCVVESEELSLVIKGNNSEVGADISPLPSGVDNPAWLMKLTTPAVPRLPGKEVSSAIISSRR